MSTLGQQISESLRNITDLILSTNDYDTVRELARQQRALSEQLQTLVDATVPERTEEYQLATASLGEANAELALALEDTQRLEGGLRKLAEATERVVRLVGTLA